MRAFVIRLDTLHKKLLSGLAGLGSFWIFVLMAVIVSDVAGRVFFGKPLQGTPEIVSNSIIAITFLQIPYVMLRKQHVRSTLIFDKMPARGRNCIDIVAAIIGILLFSFLIISSWGHFITAIQIGEFEGEGALRVPTSPARFIVILGSALMIVEYILSILRLALKIEDENIKVGVIVT